MSYKWKVTDDTGALLASGSADSYSKAEDEALDEMNLLGYEDLSGNYDYSIEKE